MACVKKRFKQTQICTGDLRNLITIQERSLSAAGFDDNEPTEVFTPIGTAYAGIVTTSSFSQSAALFAGVAIDQVGTHTFTVPFSTLYSQVEQGNNFILFDDRRFKIVRREIKDENKQFINLFCNERGSVDQSASEA